MNQKSIMEIFQPVIDSMKKVESFCGDPRALFQQLLDATISNPSCRYLSSASQTAFICQFLENLGQLKGIDDDGR